ncbi:hypothetical protein BKH43_01105 [Helicobacter sp. 13S00401-1]|uniref:hypothetical protein n=1 Tax=Helicobacter sp. 13S00401-1 TaxID=1905758 RepID=UPI000BA79DFE|nr:hypothetical protein [Helicobacter sp. 13S00401-1]PAF51862.1 hypothetical protein BKH43_01105 [Helicobacter sp. 13S00401-1]
MQESSPKSDMPSSQEPLDKKDSKSSSESSKIESNKVESGIIDEGTKKDTKDSLYSDVLDSMPLGDVPSNKGVLNDPSSIVLVDISKQDEVQKLDDEKTSSEAWPATSNIDNLSEVINLKEIDSLEVLSTLKPSSAQESTRLQADGLEDMAKKDFLNLQDSQDSKRTNLKKDKEDLISSDENSLEEVFFEAPTTYAIDNEEAHQDRNGDKDDNKDDANLEAKKDSISNPLSILDDTTPLKPKKKDSFKDELIEELTKEFGSQNIKEEIKEDAKASSDTNSDEKEDPKVIVQDDLSSKPLKSSSHAAKAYAEIKDIAQDEHSKEELKEDQKQKEALAKKARHEEERLRKAREKAELREAFDGGKGSNLRYAIYSNRLALIIFGIAIIIVLDVAYFLFGDNSLGILERLRVEEKSLSTQVETSRLENAKLHKEYLEYLSLEPPASDTTSSKPSSLLSTQPNQASPKTSN